MGPGTELVVPTAIGLDRPIEPCEVRRVEGGSAKWVAGWDVDGGLLMRVF